MALRAARAFKLDLAGIDLLMPDISVPWYEKGAAICEVNAKPELGTTAPLLSAPILKELLRGNGRVPVTLVFGDGPDLSASRGIAKSFRKGGKSVGYFDGHRVYHR